MKNVLKLIRRFVGLMLLSSVLFLILNIVFLMLISSSQKSSGRPWNLAQECADSFSKTETGWTLPKPLLQEIRDANAWGIYIDNATHQVIWQTDALPKGIPTTYTLAQIAELTRGYLADYPTFSAGTEKGIMILGYPKDSFWKHMWPNWDYQTIAHFPQILLMVLGGNTVLILVIYLLANSRLLKSVGPIAKGILKLPTKEPVHLREKGLLSEIAMNINRTSEILQAQNLQLRKKETARANWIAGVSHDIRTPLSMVMGYAGQLSEDPQLPKEAHQKAMVIVRQSQRMKNLINDLNLASKLEYNMQPLHTNRQNLLSVVRQITADFINMDIEEKYPVFWDTEEHLTCCPVLADADLMKRAVGNLLQNSINHNPQGCSIHVQVSMEESRQQCCIIVADDGIGLSEEEIQKLNHTPHYMVCDTNTAEQRHGLGLLLVRQITDAHKGTIEISKSPFGGLQVSIHLPLAL